MRKNHRKSRLNRLKIKLPKACPNCLGDIELLKVLLEILCKHAGERGETESAPETLTRILWERNRALTVLALERLKL